MWRCRCRRAGIRSRARHACGGNIPAANVADETNLNSNADAALNVNIDDEIKQGLAIQAFSIEDVEAYKKQRLSNLEIENEQLELENSEILGE